MFFKTFFCRDGSLGFTPESKKLSDANGASLGRVELKPKGNDEEPLKRNLKATPLYRQSHQEEIEKGQIPRLSHELPTEKQKGSFSFNTLLIIFKPLDDHFE